MKPIIHKVIEKDNLFLVALYCDATHMKGFWDYKTDINTKHKVNCKRCIYFYKKKEKIYKRKSKTFFGKKYLRRL